MEMVKGVVPIPHDVYLGLGSNQGDRENYLREAVSALDEHPGISVLRQSGLYETKPVGPVEQGDFLNMAVAVRTDLPPHELLIVIHEIEGKLHRERTIRWGPRTVDIDILLYGDEMISDEKLTIPHKEMLGRAFVLIPLGEVYTEPELCGRTYVSLLDSLKDKEEVRPYRKAPNYE